MVKQTPIQKAKAKIKGLEAIVKEFHRTKSIDKTTISDLRESSERKSDIIGEKCKEKAKMKAYEIVLLNKLEYQNDIMKAMVSLVNQNNDLERRLNSSINTNQSNDNA